MTGHSKTGHTLSSRRGFLLSAGAAAASLAVPARLAFASNPAGEGLHGISAFGELKYAPDFSHFDYVNPQAPKGGTFSFLPPNWYYNQNYQTFNTLNTFILRGDAPPRMELCFDRLMIRAIDEPDALYCHLAEWVESSQDRNIWRFGVRPEARFHDGTPVLAEDVAFSFLTLKEDGHPTISSTLRDLTDAVVLDERTVEIRFSGEQSAQSILSAANIHVLSSTYYETHDFTAGSLDIPLSSGPYRPGRFEPGTFINLDRVDDYWARDLPTARGLDNFDTIRMEFFAERQAGFEAFKKGDIVFRQEFTSKTWETEYGFPAIVDGRVIKTTFPSEKRPIMQAWAVNQRRAKLADRRVREAVNLCFDFEWTNNKIFYNAYTRSQSLFQRSEFVADGSPDEAERALLDPIRDQVPEEVFGDAVMQPVSDGSGRDRQLLRRAVQLLSEAGWSREGTALKKDGEVLTLEILIRSPVFERLLSGFVENLRRVGIQASMRLVDPAQFQSRLDEFDFDMVGYAISFSATPTAESLSTVFAPHLANRPGSQNLPGVNAPVYETLLDYVEAAQSRAELVTAMRVLDRVNRARLDWIPNWYSANHRVAYWDMFGFVEPKPDFEWPVERLWWLDQEKAKKIGKA
ncbi:extracellular solute-binding protein [Hoeflea prorocentri]|uniref:Extracellular solute-binding protein n=1 Tax=Hoeflea prorocentri TaxID=1922333 RepID=A0A9X3UPR6_9HYPH|nr:extracellular solute-binding protein [Hoeflea prorocentri]MCY6382956.1 extracellular solute-binding protein [Hoeflea prorocentri]MDA5400756.1 extracellular solute-binding protein [Hoeflea prorocentri]